MANFPLIWTESGADTQNNNWGQVIKDWATTEHSTTGTHGAVTSTSLSVSGAAGIGGIAVPASGLAVLGTSAGIVGQINITSGGIAVNGINASTSSAAVVGQSTGYYGGHFYNITDLGSDLANASAIGIVGHSVYSNAFYAQQGSVLGSPGATLQRNNIYPAAYVTRVVGDLNGFNFTAPTFRIDDTTTSTGDLFDIKRNTVTVSRMLTTGKLGLDASGGSVASPSHALDVKGANSIAAVFRGFGGATTNTCQVRLAGRQDGEVWAIGVDIDGAGSGARPFDIYDLVGGASRLQIDTNGDIKLFRNLSLGNQAISTTTFALFGAGTTGKSSLRVPHGSAPSSPVDGDIWTTTAGLFVRVNGATVGPLS